MNIIYMVKLNKSFSSRGRKSRGRKSRGRKSRGRKSRGRKSRKGGSRKGGSRKGGSRKGGSRARKSRGGNLSSVRNFVSNMVDNVSGTLSINPTTVPPQAKDTLQNGSIEIKPSTEFLKVLNDVKASLPKTAENNRSSDVTGVTSSSGVDTNNVVTHSHRIGSDGNLHSHPVGTESTGNTVHNTR